MKVLVVFFLFLSICACTNDQYVNHHSVCFSDGSCIEEHDSGYRQGNSAVSGRIGVAGRNGFGAVSFGNNSAHGHRHHPNFYRGNRPVYIQPSYQNTTYQNGNTIISKGTYYPGGYYWR